MSHSSVKKKFVPIKMHFSKLQYVNIVNKVTKMQPFCIGDDRKMGKKRIHYDYVIFNTSSPFILRIIRMACVCVDDIGVGISRCSNALSRIGWRAVRSGGIFYSYNTFSSREHFRGVPMYKSLLLHTKQIAFVAT